MTKANLQKTVSFSTQFELYNVPSKTVCCNLSQNIMRIWWKDKCKEIFDSIVVSRFLFFASSWQRKEAEGTPQKQLPTATTPMT